MQTPTRTVDVGTLHEAAACISPALGPGPSTEISRLCGCLGPPGGSPRLHRRAWAPARGSGVLPAQGTGPLSQLQPCRPATTHRPHGAAQSRSGGDGDRGARPQGGVSLAFDVCRGV